MVPFSEAESVTIPRSRVSWRLVYGARVVTPRAYARQRRSGTGNWQWSERTEHDIGEWEMRWHQSHGTRPPKGHDRGEDANCEMKYEYYYYSTTRARCLAPGCTLLRWAALACAAMHRTLRRRVGSFPGVESCRVRLAGTEHGCGCACPCKPGSARLCPCPRALCPANALQALQALSTCACQAVSNSQKVLTTSRCIWR